MNNVSMGKNNANEISKRKTLYSVIFHNRLHIIHIMEDNFNILHNLEDMLYNNHIMLP